MTVRLKQNTKIFSIRREPPPIPDDYIDELTTGKGRTAMQYEFLLPHYDDLLRLAAARCRTQADAEDLAADTMLAALIYLRRGGVIAHPRTWLANTLMHKINSAHRRAYRASVISYEALDDTLCDGDLPFDEAMAEAEADEAAELRRVLLYLAATTREVLIRYYYGGESVEAIAAALGIPAGTVKSRLAAGRGQIKKGMEKMEQKKNHIPASLSFSWGGRLGKNRAPVSRIEGDLIAQNLLILAYKKPLSASELAWAIGIPTVYIEPILARLVEGELMGHTERDRYYTDFILYTHEDYSQRLSVQLAFVRENFDAIWAPLGQLTEALAGLDFVSGYGAGKRQKLIRYAVLTALQRFKQSYIDRAEFDFPRRRDGGKWNLFGTVLPAEAPSHTYAEIDEYCLGGERVSNGNSQCSGAEKVVLREYDTPFYDHPGRFGIVGWEVYFDHIHAFLWSLHRGLDPKEAQIPNAMIEAIPQFTTAGLLVREGDRLLSDIPVLSETEYAAIGALIDQTAEALRSAVGAAFAAMMTRAEVEVPPHLQSVPSFRRRQPAIFAFELAVEREAHTRGLHMQGLDGCCPPVVLVWR